jgi:hypothetical protein
MLERNAINYNDVYGAIESSINNRKRKLVVNEFIEIDYNNCEFLMWMDDSPDRYFDDVDSLGNFIYNEDKYYENLFGFDDLRIDSSSLYQAMKNPRFTFDKTPLLEDYNIEFTKDIYENGSFRMSPVIATNKKDIYVLLSSFVSIDNSSQHNFTLKISKGNIEILDRRYVDWCYLGSDYFFDKRNKAEK